MSERFVEAFVEKLILLEGTKGARGSSRLLLPAVTRFQDQDILSIQAAAKMLAEFIGLGDFTFLIAIAKQKLAVGGHIDLSTRGREIFIEIDGEVMKFPDAVAATLCHELCHKWLQTHGLPSAHIEVENEILTDITTVHLGLGKIMLNGCEAERYWTETLPGATQEPTEKITVGYLKRDQLAFAYRLVCAMRNIPESDSFQGLNSKALQAVQSCDSSFGHYYDSRFHGPDTAEALVQGFHDRLIALQHGFADINKYVAYVRKSFCETGEGFFKEGHQKVEALRQRVAEAVGTPESGLGLRFLRAIQKKHEVDRVEGDLQALQQNLSGLLGTARQLGLSLSRNGTRFPLPSSEMFRIVICPRDGTKLRLPEKPGDIMVRCPSCKYQFAYNTHILMLAEPPAPRAETWGERFWKMIRWK